MPVGTVTWGDPPQTATLRDDLTWEVPGDPDLAGRLDLLYRGVPTGPSAGTPGAIALHDFADMVGGKVRFEPKIADAPGVVY